jgi:hypothetical protein
MEARVPSPDTTLLILLGASEWPSFPEFQGSEAFANAARELKAYFLDPKRFRLPPENALDMFNSNRDPNELDEQIGRFLDQRLAAMKAAGHAARDLLVYFVGHGGFVGHDHDFFLAIRPTREKSPRTSGISMLSLADTLTEKTRHLRRIIILDCCFAAAAFAAFQAGPALVALEKTNDAFEVKHRSEGFPAKGTALLCSSSHKTPSLLLPDGSSTMFTKALLDALAEGMPPQRDRLSLRDVKNLAADFLYDMRDAPKPVVLSPDQSEGDVADIPFFPNPQAHEQGGRQAEEAKRRLAGEAEWTPWAEEERQRRVVEEHPHKNERDTHAPPPIKAQSGIHWTLHLPEGRQARQIILLVVVLLVIGGSSSAGFFIIRNNQLASDHAHATVTAQATIYARLTATAQVHATADAIGLHNPYSGKLALNDPMKDNSKGYGWLVTSTIYGDVQFSGGAYHIRATKAGYIDDCPAYNTDFSNFAYQIEMTIIKGDYGGIVFRHSEAHGGQEYYLRIGRDGSYDFFYLTTDSASTSSLKMGFSGAIKTGLNQSNIIAVVVYNDFFYVYINGKYITSLEDKTFSHGSIGAAADSSNGPAEVVFRNAKVWTF